MGDCWDCGGFDIEWMYKCQNHPYVEYCRGCSCPVCEEEANDDGDFDYLNAQFEEENTTAAGDAE